MTHWNFPGLSRPAIFLGSPGDMAYLREVARAEFDNIMREAHGRRDVDLYRWDDEKFKDWLSFPHMSPSQGSILLTSDPYCQAAIFLFGEQIGAPLPADFPLPEGFADFLAKLRQHKRHAPIHPWDPSQSTKGFPLTGSTFAYLLAEFAGKEVLVLFCGDESIKDDNRTVKKQKWGMWRFRTANKARFGEDEDTYFQWLNEKYWPALELLRNFHRYISRDCNRPSELVSDEETARQFIRSFLINSLDLAAPSRIAQWVASDSALFDVFLSHNSRDKPTVRQLAKALQARGLKVWLDEDQLVPGRPWQDALENIIQTAQTAAVLVGKDGLGPWEDPEMRSCLSEFVKRRMPVIPVLLPDAPAEPKLPLLLQSFTWVDLRGGLTDHGIDLLEWGITEIKPNRLPSSLRPPHSVETE